MQLPSWAKEIENTSMAEVLKQVIVDMSKPMGLFNSQQPLSSRKRGKETVHLTDIVTKQPSAKTKNIPCERKRSVYVVAAQLVLFFPVYLVFK